MWWGTRVVAPPAPDDGNVLLRLERGPGTESESEEEGTLRDDARSTRATPANPEEPPRRR